MWELQTTIPFTNNEANKYKKKTKTKQTKQTNKHKNIKFEKQKLY